MIKPKKLPNEPQRLAELYSYDILDSLPEEDYDNLTEIAAGICGTPISLVTLIDDERQWFKSRHNLEDVEETPRDLAFCAHAIHRPNEILEVKDARVDERFHDNPFVTAEDGIVFYAGSPLVTSEGHALGTLCVIDTVPKELTETERKSLKALSQQVVRLFELRKKEKALEQAAQKINEHNQDLNNLLSQSIKDLKPPLNNITNLSRIFMTDKSIRENESKYALLKQMDTSSLRLKSLLKGLEVYQMAQNIQGTERLHLTINQLKDSVVVMPNVQVDWHTTLESAYLHFDGLKLIFSQLLDNAVRFNHNQQTIINISIEQQLTTYIFRWTDNSQGIPAALVPKAFGLYQTLVDEDKHGKATYGIGLAAVKAATEAMGGTIHADTQPSEGMHFVMALPINYNKNNIGEAKRLAVAK